MTCSVIVQAGLLVSVAACGMVNFEPQPAPDAQPGVVDADARPITPVAMPALAASASRHNLTSTMLSFRLTVPPGSDRFLLVSAGIGSSCGGTTVPTVREVSYAGSPLVRVAALTGTPCGPGNTRSELWQLVAPAEGTYDVLMNLTAPAPTLHGVALAFTGIHQQLPVRTSKTASGAGSMASVAVDSEVGDLVASFVGQGNRIDDVGPGQTKVLTDNASPSNTLDNSAASIAPGATPVVAMDWVFTSTDEWQMIVASLRPR